MSAAESLAQQRVGTYSAYLPSLEAAYTVGHTVVRELLDGWSRYRKATFTSEIPSNIKTQ